MTIGTFDWLNDKTISNTQSVNRFPFIKPGTAVELAVFFLIFFGNLSKTRQIGKNASLFLKFSSWFETQNQDLAYHLLSYCKTTVTAYVTKYRHLQQFCCKPLNWGSVPFSVIETTAELKSTMFYFHCSVFMTWNTWTNKLVFAKGNIPAFHVSENTNNHNFVRFNTWSVLIHDCRRALTYSFHRLVNLIPTRIITWFHKDKVS